MSRYMTISAIFNTETSAAVCVNIGDGEDTWIPKSQIDDWQDDEHERGDVIEFEVATWFCEKEGLV